MNQDIYNWAKKYHKGQLSETEWQSLLEAMEREPQWADEFYAILTLLQGGEKEMPEVNVQQALEKHLKREQPGQKPIRLFMVQYWWKIAAIMVPILLLIKVFWTTSPELAPVMVTRTADSASMEIVLPDSSQVVLAPFSSISWQEDFKVRNLDLSGEAFFSVYRDTLRPFAVHAGASTVRVLGTAFSVRALDNQPVQVEVLHGKVAVVRDQEQKSVILTALETTVWDTVQRTWSTHYLPDEGNVAWATRVWKIDQKRLEEVIPGLEKMYGITLEVAEPSLLQCRVSATLDHKSEQEMLEILKLILQVQVEHRNGKIVLNGPGC